MSGQELLYRHPKHCTVRQIQRQLLLLQDNPGAHDAARSTITVPFDGRGEVGKERLADSIEIPLVQVARVPVLDIATWRGWDPRPEIALEL